jgi:hypothetical protein
MSIDSHLSTCVCTESPKYLEMAQGHISLSVGLFPCIVVIYHSKVMTSVFQPLGFALVRGVIITLKI